MILQLRPKHAVSQAIGYLTSQEEALRVCITQPEIPIHNNFSELQIRGPVTGRKNWLFAGSEGGTHAATCWFSLMASCRLHKVNPFAYLVWLFQRLNLCLVHDALTLSPHAYAALGLGDKR